VTAGELFQRYVPGARTVKAFSTIYFEHLVALARPAGAPDRSALPIAGDDAAAKESVAALLDRLGYDTVDVGAMAESWRVQQGGSALPVRSATALAPGPGRAGRRREASCGPRTGNAQPGGRLLQGGSDHVGLAPACSGSATPLGIDLH
jgi:hypothetical protein